MTSPVAMADCTQIETYSHRPEIGMSREFFERERVLVWICLETVKRALCRAPASSLESFQGAHARFTSAGGGKVRRSWSKAAPEFYAEARWAAIRPAWLPLLLSCFSCTIARGNGALCASVEMRSKPSLPRSAEKQRSDLMKVAAVVLAAGGSTRFGKPKQFALFQGETFVRRIVRAAIEAGCVPVVVVTGEDSAQVTLELSGLAVSIAVNPHWQSGLGSSVVVGIRHAINLAPDLDAALLLTCDQPFVTAAVITQLIQLRVTSGKPIIASAYAETLGIPALFDRSCFPDLLGLKEDSGAKKIILARPHDVVAFNFPAGKVDIDTPADYEKLDQPLAADGTRLG